MLNFLPFFYFCMPSSTAACRDTNSPAPGFKLLARLIFVCVLSALWDVSIRLFIVSSLPSWASTVEAKFHCGSIKRHRVRCQQNIQFFVSHSRDVLCRLKFTEWYWRCLPGQNHYYSQMFKHFQRTNDWRVPSLPPCSVPAAVRAGKLWESEGVLSEGAEPPERPLQGHVPSRHRLLSPGWLRMCPTLPAWRQEPRTHRWGRAVCSGTLTEQMTCILLWV